ncbi:PIN domain-containing protein [Deinococcus sp. A31D244]|uniref:PIN domain-containing protein n=1 Tax=Deinococcus sp. A31D244 TaxID=3397675 RepID=UPI0039DFD17E
MQDEQDFLPTLVFPSASNIFDIDVPDPKTIIKEAIIFLDTNVLLIPYKTGKESLQAIEKIYIDLKSEGRLRIPAQAAREFAHQRTEHLKNLYATLSKNVQAQNIPDIDHPLFEEDKIKLNNAKKELNESIQRFNNIILEMRNKVNDWNYNDPVTKIYKNIFTPDIIIESELSESDLKKELRRRNILKIPPGYSDEGKEANSAGDMLIWLQAVEEAAKMSRPLIIVSADRKKDWWAQSTKQPLYPRFELAYEYYIKSSGQSMGLITLSELLQLTGSPNTVITEIETASHSIAEDSQPKSNSLIEELRKNFVSSGRQSYWFSRHRYTPNYNLNEELKRRCEIIGANLSKIESHDIPDGCEIYSISNIVPKSIVVISNLESIAGGQFDVITEGAATAGFSHASFFITGMSGNLITGIDAPQIQDALNMIMKSFGVPSYYLEYYDNNSNSPAIILGRLPITLSGLKYSTP